MKPFPPVFTIRLKLGTMEAECDAAGRQVHMDIPKSLK